MAANTSELEELLSVFFDLESNIKFRAVATTNSTNEEGERP
jgi:hypothetical protein